MAWLGVVFALLVGYELAVELGPDATRVVSIAVWSIWALFLVEFSLKLALAPQRLRYLRRHWWQVGLLLIPALRVLSFLRLLRLGRALPAGRVLSSSYRAAGTARHLLGGRLAYLGGLSVILTIAVAELAFLFERDEAQGAFGNFGDALLWSASAILGLQGDPVPASVGGRIAMLIGFAAGLVVVASFAGIVGAFLVDERRERASKEP